VIAVDTNILVYAHRADSAFHTRAQARVRALAEDGGAWAIPWPCVHEFFAIVTHPRIYVPHTPIEAAVDQLEAWLESPTLVLLAEGEGYWPVLRRCIELARVQGARIHDGRIAALCAAHGVSELWSADRDFSRFGDVRVVNPLAG
jgi:uncharacterized protein